MKNIVKNFTLLFLFLLSLCLFFMCCDNPKQTPVNTAFEPIKKTYQFEFSKLSGGDIPCDDGTLAWFKNNESAYHMLKYKLDKQRGVFDISYNDYVITSIAPSTKGESVDKGFIKIDSNLVTVVRHSDKLEISVGLVKFYGFNNNSCVEVKIAQFQ